MSELVGETYGDDHDDDEAPPGMREHGTEAGHGDNDDPATTGTHRGWGDPQADED